MYGPWGGRCSRPRTCNRKNSRRTSRIKVRAIQPRSPALPKSFPVASWTFVCFIVSTGIVAILYLPCLAPRLAVEDRGPPLASRQRARQRQDRNEVQRHPAVTTAARPCVGDTA